MTDDVKLTADLPRVLVVDDEQSICHVLGTYLERRRCAVTTASSTEQALELLDTYEPEVAFVDLVMPGRNGLELLAEIKQRYPDTEVVMITSHGSADAAVGAIRLGAYEFLQKPFGSLEEVWAVLERGLEKRRLTIEIRRLSDAADRLPAQ